MSLSREAMMELMAYADGELSDDAAALARIEALVQSSDEARRIVEAMQGLGEVVRELPEAHRADGGVADGIADGVMAKIGDAAIAPVVSLSQRRAIGRAHYATAAAAALALAAGVALYLRSNEPASGYVAVDQGHEPSPVVQPAPGTSEPPSPAVSVAANAPAPPKSDEVDLEEVESQDHHVSVFYVPKSITGAASANAGASVVVWIDDHGGH
jgi:hypothetical protein